MSTSLRVLHRTSRRCLSSGSWQADRGGASVERQIAQSLRALRSREYPVVVEVMDARHVDWAARQLPSGRLLRAQSVARVWMRALTHADLLSDRALRHQVGRASVMDGRGRQVPVVALNLRDVQSLKVKQTLPIMHMLSGANMIIDAHRRPNGAKDGDGNRTNSSGLLVCGLPNAGKSSLIYPLTKGRTQTETRKRGHDLPSVNATPGWTEGKMSHSFEVGGATVSMTDTPGLRPRLEGLSTKELAVWLATRSVRPRRGMLAGDDPGGESLREEVVAALWGGLRRHARICSQPLGFESPEALRSFHFEDQRDEHIDELIHACALGKYGGMIIGDESAPAPPQGEQTLLTIESNRTMLAMNRAAALLMDVGAGREDAADAKNSVLFVPERTGVRPSRTPGYDGRRRQERQREFLRLPEYQQRVQCMKCAGFIKTKNTTKSAEMRGRHYPRVINWDEHHIRSFYTRMVEAFGFCPWRRSHGRYLMKDSLAQTLRQKFKLSSRRKVYKKFRKDLGGYPVENGHRPLRFQSDQPIPLKGPIECTNRSKSACRNLTAEAKEVLARGYEFKRMAR